MTHDTWHVTHNTWHMTHDMWYLTCDTWWQVNILSTFQLLNSWDRQCLEYSEIKDDFMNKWKGEQHCVVSHNSVWLFPLCEGYQKPVNDTRDMSGIPHSCLGCVSQVYSLSTVKLMLSKAKFWLKKVDSQLARLQDLLFGNQETRQLELWNMAQWEILSIVPGKVLWRKCIGALLPRLTGHFCEITVCKSPSHRNLSAHGQHSSPLPLERHTLHVYFWATWNFQFLMGGRARFEVHFPSAKNLLSTF